jgi:hypothetical protein
LYQASRTFSGTVDNKAMNRTLSKLGLVEGGEPLKTPKGKIRTGQGAGIVPGTGRPVDAEFRQRDPFGWLIKWVLPKVEAEAKKGMTKQEKKAADKRAAEIRAAGGTEEEIAEARQPLRAKLQSVMDQMFPGMPGTSRTALADTIFSHAQAQSGLAQAKDVLAQDPKAIMAKSWTAQLDKLRETLNSKAQDLGDDVAKALGLDKKISTIEAAIRTGDYGVLGDAVTKAKEGLDLIMSPQKLGAELLLKGATKLWEVGTALLKKLGIVPDDSDEGKRKDEITKARETLAKPTEKQLPKEIEDAIELIRKINEERQKKIDALPPKERARLAEPVLRDIHRGNVTITSLMVQHGTFNVPQGWGLPGFKTPGTPQPAEPKDPFGAKPGALAPTPNWMSDLQTTLGDFSTSTTGWVNDMSQVPTKFESTFTDLKTAGTDAGTNFSTNAITGVKNGAGEAGGIFGDRAIGAIKAGLATLNLSANINVNSVTQTGDKGPRTGD